MFCSSLECNLSHTLSTSSPRLQHRALSIVQNCNKSGTNVIQQESLNNVLNSYPEALVLGKNVRKKVPFDQDLRRTLLSG